MFPRFAQLKTNHIIDVSRHHRARHRHLLGTIQWIWPGAKCQAAFFQVPFFTGSHRMNMNCMNDLDCQSLYHNWWSCIYIYTHINIWLVLTYIYINYIKSIYIKSHTMTHWGYRYWFHKGHVSAIRTRRQRTKCHRDFSANGGHLWQFGCKSWDK